MKTTRQNDSNATSIAAFFILPFHPILFHLRYVPRVISDFLCSKQETVKNTNPLDKLWRKILPKADSQAFFNWRCWDLLISLSSKIVSSARDKNILRPAGPWPWIILQTLLRLYTMGKQNFPSFLWHENGSVWTGRLIMMAQKNSSTKNREFSPVGPTQFTGTCMVISVGTAPWQVGRLLRFTMGQNHVAVFQQDHDPPKFEMRHFDFHKKSRIFRCTIKSF